MEFNNILIIGEESIAKGLADKFNKETVLVNIYNGSIEELSLFVDDSTYDLVIDLQSDPFHEDVIERIQVIEKQLNESATLSTFSLKVSTTEIVQRLINPSRFIGLNFFRLHDQTNLVEIVIPEFHYNQDLTNNISAFLEQNGFVTVKVKDRPGLLSYRLITPYLNQASQVFDDGIATAVDIDNSVKLGLGYPIGPLELLDQMGLENYIPLTDALHKELPETKYATPPILKRMNGVGRINKKFVLCEGSEEND